MLVIDFNDMNKMPPITKETALEIRNHHNDDTGFSSKVSKVCFSRFPEYQLPKKAVENFMQKLNFPSEMVLYLTYSHIIYFPINLHQGIFS